MAETTVTLSCGEHGPSAPGLVDGTASEVAHLSSVMLHQGDLLIQGRPQTISWTHGESAARLNQVTIDLDVAARGHARDVRATAAWLMIGSCRGPRWESARPLALRAGSIAAVAPGTRRALEVGFETVEVDEDCVGVRVRLESDGNALELDLPLRTYRFEPQDISGELE